MKSALIFTAMIFLAARAHSEEKNEAQIIAKGIQCTYLREKSFLDIYELYSTEKANPEYIKKVSDSIYAQAFKICDPENNINADKEILNVCATGCTQFVTKGILGLGGPSSNDIEKCKKMCLNYSDLLSLNYTSASKALKKYIEINPPTPKKVDPPENNTTLKAPPSTTPPPPAENEVKK